MRPNPVFPLLFLCFACLPTASAANPEEQSTPENQGAYDTHIRQLRAKLPGDGFTIVIQKPFVVIGDEAPDVVRRRATQTVGWAVTRLKRQYFAKNPDRILNVWLFRDKDSYERNAMRLFRSKPSTPYGYYSPANDALVMNIATGGGTLVHEIVHPFVEANFPACPSWLNEGLGSLYEQSASRGEKIVGLTNWRLVGLQRAIQKDTVPTFSQLCHTTRSEFYDDDPGTNYAQARYLCYYLQEHDLLEKFYHQFVADQKTDPTGYATLQRVLGSQDTEQNKDQDMDAFQDAWQSYVMKLRFPS